MDAKFINEIYEIDPKLVRKIAKDWVEISTGGIKPTDQVMIIYDIAGRQLAKEVAKLVAEKGARVWYRVRELELDAELLERLSERDIARYFQHYNNEIMEADVVFMIRAAKDAKVMSKVPADKSKIYQEASRPIYRDYRVNYTNWQLIYWPMPQEAEIEGLSFGEYLEIFANACNQPWQQIKKAQEKIKKILDKAETLELYANTESKDPKQRTHLTMSIKGMEFLSSTIRNNYPGSELFSSPVRESVEGQLFAKGKYMLGHSFKIVEDIYFKIENGKIVEASARKGESDLIDLLNTDEGARYFGEVAFGTNPGLRRRLFNPLLNEKVGGSFHITPGSAYRDTEDEEGKLTHIDNGNRSAIHWDITILMLPEYGGGRVVVDGKVIQENGKWLVKGAEVLNKGL